MLKNRLTNKELKSNIDRPDNAEDVWLNVQCRKVLSVRVGCIPKTPQETFSETFRDVLEIGTCSSYILGDMNDDFVFRGN